jgi:tetratricopeptide (TPR) repeat protein
MWRLTHVMIGFMPRTVFSSYFPELGATIQELLSNGHSEIAAQTLEHALKAANTEHQQNTIAQTLNHTNPALRASPRWAGLCARLYCITRNLNSLQELLETQPNNLSAYRAWLVLKQDQNPKQALKLARASELNSQGYELGLALRTQAIALFETQQTGWQEVFERACDNLTESSLGRCQIDWGRALEHNGQHIEARGVWAKALHTLQSDPYYAAIIYYNIGLSCLKSGEPEAEQAFYNMRQTAQRFEAAEFKARAQCGLAASRRALGELERALYTYQIAQKIKSDTDDQRQILRGIGHTRRLLGQYTQALSDLEKATQITEQDIETQNSWVHADIAALHAQLGNIQGAREALTRTGDLGRREEDYQRASIVKAEIARLEHQPKNALRYLNEVNPNRLWTWEEAKCFPKLFTLWDKAKGTKTKTISVIRNVIQVRLFGTIRVEVNNRPIPLKSNGRPAELFGLLVYHGGNLSSERVNHYLFPEESYEQHPRNRKTLSQFVKTLRQTLGWNDSIQNRAGRIELDPNSEWRSDLEPRNPKRSRFLDGMASEWILEVNQKYAPKSE